jgi:dTDP-4-dehydrorhamnose reductase
MSRSHTHEVSVFNATFSPPDLTTFCRFDGRDLTAMCVIGAAGQLGRALKQHLPDADFADRSHIDLSNQESLNAVQWPIYDTVINAAAYTAVDEAETSEGRIDCWDTNVTGVARLMEHVRNYGLTLVHISSDYVFDGLKNGEYTETDQIAPLGVYGQSKAASDALVATLPKHYIVRTSWVIGEGDNFVRTMHSLAERGVDPKVVDDQIGRLSFTDDLASGIIHLLRSGADFGIYNITNAGRAMSWLEVATHVFELSGHDPSRITGVSTTQYFAEKSAAPRPRNGRLAMEKLVATGFQPRHISEALQEYVSRL